MSETNGNAVVDADLTAALTGADQEKPGQSANQTDLTEDDKTLEGLSRRVTSLKKQLAKQALEPDDETKAKITVAEERAVKAEARAAKAELILKYGDVAPIIKKLMDKPNFDASLIDDEFVNEIRAAKGTPKTAEGEEEEPRHNTVRSGGRLSPDKQDEENVKNLGSIFDLS